MQPVRLRRRLFFYLLPAVLVGSVLAGVSAAGGASGPVRITTVSDRADLISGGDALVHVSTPGTSSGAVHLTLNGRNITSVFRQHSNGHGLGLVSGLRLGRNELVATVPDGRGARLAPSPRARCGRAVVRSRDQDRVRWSVAGTPT